MSRGYLKEWSHFRRWFEHKCPRHSFVRTRLEGCKEGVRDAFLSILVFSCQHLSSCLLTGSTHEGDFIAFLLSSRKPEREGYLEAKGTYHHYPPVSKPG